jgi:hydroxymethylpyrimidine/phosphomethylpyrimidine kinase
MNIDSKIMDSILIKLMDKGILGLSVFDSVIVAEQHQDCVYELMMEEYKKEMGFEPIIG